LPRFSGLVAFEVPTCPGFTSNLVEPNLLFAASSLTARDVSAQGRVASGIMEVLRSGVLSKARSGLRFLGRGLVGGIVAKCGPAQSVCVCVCVERDCEARVEFAGEAWAYWKRRPASSEHNEMAQRSETATTYPCDSSDSNGICGGKIMK
jgi:hypothetical protein